MVTKICETCRNEFQIPECRREKAKYCSKKCCTLQVEKVCNFCDKKFKVHKYREKTAKYCSKSCAGKDRPMEQNTNWKGGRSLMKNGYIRIRVNGIYVYEHRHIMEKILGRKLKRKESVHHINKKRIDNRPENFRLMVKKDHDRLETSFRWQNDPDSFKQK